MSLKQRLFGPEWQHRDAARRARAIASHNDAELFEQLPKIATSDPDETVRLTALKRLDDETLWLESHGHDASEKVRDAARQTLMHRVLHSTDTTNVQRRVEWIKGLNDREVLRRTAREAEDPGVRRALLQQISAQGFLGDCAIAENVDEIAAELIQRIDQTSTLDRIAPAIKKRNKRRYQLLVQHRSALQHPGAGDTANHEFRSRLIHQAERLARGDAPGDRRQEAERLQVEWDSLGDGIEEGLQRRFEGAMRIVQQSLSTSRENSRPQTNTAPEAPAPLPPEVVTLGEQASTLATQAINEKSDAALNQLISEFDRFRNQHRGANEVTKAEFQRIQALIGELQARLETQRTRSSKPESVQKPEGDASPEHKQTDSPDPNAEIQPLLERAANALDSGHLTDAWTTLGEARKRIDSLSSKGPAQKLGAELGRLHGRLREMRDWQHWSNNELRERLIERVDEIDAEQLHPDAVTARLKELRGRWNELENQERMPGEKRRHAAPQGQWRRFQKACQQTFETAKPYLEQRSEVRDLALQELQQFVDEAEGVAADTNRSSHDLLRYQRAARAAIRNLDALPPPKRGPMANALRALMDSLSASLQRHFDAIADEKRRLIAEARKLPHERDRDQAIERAKALQADWKKIGRTRRKLDDKLWSEFREPIDPLFADLEQARDQQRVEQQAHTDAIAALCSRAEDLAKDDDPIAAAGPMAGLREEINTLGNVPAALKKRFDKAVAQHEQGLEQVQLADAQRQQAQIETAAEAVQSAWAAMLDNHRPAPLPDVDPALQDDPVYTGLRAKLERLQAAEAASSLATEFDAKADEAREIVIEMECIAGLETPAHDHAQRMTIQVRRLSNRLGHGAARPDLDAERAQLHSRWFETFPHEPKLHAELAPRFHAAEKILDQMIRA